jgi:thioesterase domain-containing protein
VGVPGELYVGGVGLARGYLNDPELTAERFVADPFSGVPGARLYRTGDRCRWLADGSVEFLGRLDQQVKVRGYRIEVGEVEAALESAPAVREAAVAVHTDPAGEQRLVAFVAARAEGEQPSEVLLRRHLRERLPEYMVPSAFVLLPALPRTPSGKIDRKALSETQPEMGRLADAVNRPYVAPATPLEELLAGVWRELLQVERVGVEDNFFELGGNSLQAALCINRLQEKLGRRVGTVAMFDSPTIAGLARCLESTAGNKEEPPADHASPPTVLVPLQPHGTRPPCFMVHPPGGIVVCYQPLAQQLGTEQPFYGIRARGLHGEQELPTRLEEMAADYVVAVRGVQPEGPCHLGGWSMGGLVAFEMAQQLLAQGQQIGLLALLDTTIPVNEANRDYAEAADQGGKEYGLDLTLEELDRLGPEEQLPYLWQHVQRLGLVEPNMPPELVQQILDDLKRLFHAHVKLANDYVIRPYPGRITLFRPTESVVLVHSTPDRGWAKVAAAVDVHFVPGHHHTMVKEPQVQVLAQQLGVYLRQAQERPTQPPQALPAG